MFLVTSNKHQRLLCLNFVQRVLPAELESARSELTALLADLPPGIRVLADLSQLEIMDPECAVEIGRVMDLLNQHGVSLIVRVIPDTSKDIGLNILMIFHYSHQPRVINCQNMAEALQKLSLWA
jgi:hypothetical protein